MNGRWSLALGWVFVAVGCGAPPWQLGKPLDGRPAIPPDQAVVSPAQAAADAQKERAAGRRVLEISALQKLDAAGALSGVARLRLAELLTARATEFHALGRAIPESADLETVARLDPTRGAKLDPARAVAAAAAGDAWKAIGARDEAHAAYMRAVALGGAPAGDVGIVPRRGTVPAVIGGQPPADIDGFVFGGASLSARLVPLVAAFPWVLDHQARALFWAELLLAEDATSPDVLELVSVIWGRAGRLGGTERMLMELVYHSPDRAAGIARGAAVWDRLGRPREACAQWIRAARWRDDPEDPVWRKAYVCARRDPGAGDAKAIRDYVISRARPERRDVLAAELEGRPAAVDGGAAAAVAGGAADAAGQ
jgi:tetratricopeptide (TPR) repeat protein